jgi:hypothetical protein
MGKNKRNSGCQVHSLAPPLATEVASLIKLKSVQFSSVNLEPELPSGFDKTGGHYGL